MRTTGESLLVKFLTNQLFIELFQLFSARTSPSSSLMDRHPNDTYSFLAFNRMLIEFIALSLGESDACCEVNLTVDQRELLLTYFTH